MSSPPSGFSTLHVIEAQLVMQHCDWRSLIALARTNQRNYEMACTPFAWKHTPLALPTNVTGQSAHTRSLNLLFTSFCCYCSLVLLVCFLSACRCCFSGDQPID